MIKKNYFDRVMSRIPPTRVKSQIVSLIGGLYCIMFKMPMPNALNMSSMPITKGICLVFIVKEKLDGYCFFLL